MATTTTKTRTKRANSKSGAIRAYLKRKPEAGPTAIVAALKKKGISISPAHVSNVKARLRTSGGANGEAHVANSNGATANGRGGARRGRRPAPQDVVSLGSLLEAREFASRVGGVEKASALLDALAKLQS